MDSRHIGISISSRMRRLGSELFVLGLVAIGSYMDQRLADQSGSRLSDLMMSTPAHLGGITNW